MAKMDSKKQTRENKTKDSSESDDSFEMSDLEQKTSSKKKDSKTSGVAQKRSQKAEEKQATKESKVVEKQTPIDTQSKLIVVLDQVSFETAQTKRGIELLNSDDHVKLLTKQNRDASECRPDIAHQCLLALLDSPLNKQKRLQVLMRTQKSVMIEVHPDIRIPRTFKRFSGLIASLLTKGRIQAAGGGATLLKASKLPVGSFLPSRNCAIYRVCKKGVLVPSLNQFLVEPTSKRKQVCFLISASPSGNDSQQNSDTQVATDEEISISNYELSSIVTCSRVCYALEDIWKVL